MMYCIEMATHLLFIIVISFCLLSFIIIRLQMHESELEMTFEKD